MHEPKKKILFEEKLNYFEQNNTSRRSNFERIISRKRKRCMDK
jgi:hypothetical protein